MSDIGAAASTVRVVEPVTEPESAEIMVLPVEKVAAIPVELIVATAGTEEAQVAVCVTSWVEPSVNFAVAANCRLEPRGTDVAAGVTVMEAIAAAPTVIEVEAVTEPNDAVMFAVPKPALVARPSVPESLLMIATWAADELHVTRELTSRVLLSV